MTKYKDRLLQSQEQKDQAQSEFTNAQAQLQLQSSILSTRLEVQKSESKLEDLKSGNPLSPQAIISQMATVAEWKLGLTQLEALQQELF
jgi:hypothetical protein